MSMKTAVLYKHDILCKVLGSIILIMVANDHGIVTFKITNDGYFRDLAHVKK